MTTAAILMIVGRVIFGAFFLIAGIRNFAHFGERRVMAHQLWLAVAGAAAGDRFCHAAAGRSRRSSLVSGPLPAALVLIVFLVAATPLYHNLFMFQGKERDPHLYLTLVNITLCGGLLLVIADAL